MDFGVNYENHTSHPAPGQVILYPGGISETEILLVYGGRLLKWANLWKPFYFMNLGQYIMGGCTNVSFQYAI